jgi:prolipoprotein diacylglyceryltransferase
MYPDLSYLFHDFFGSDVDNWSSVFKTFGLMLATAFVACAILLKSELKRKEEEGLIEPLKNMVKSNDIGTWNEALINAVIAGILISKIPIVFKDFDSFKADPASVIFSSSGVWILGFLLAGALLAYHYYQTTKVKEVKIIEVVGHAHERTMDIIFMAAISGVLGSKLFSILENLDSFFADPVGQLFSGSGLTIYGGVILAFIVVYRYVKKIGIKPVYMMDIAGMGILLGYGIGRIGCQLAGDGDWGIVAAAQPEWWFLPDWLWSYNYPNNVANSGILMDHCDSEAFKATYETGRMAIEDRCKTACGTRYCHELIPKVYPTPVFETIFSLIGFGILWMMRKKVKIAGMLFFLYMIYNGIERFFIEGIRVNEKYELLGMNWSQAQYISIGFILVGIAGVVYLSKKKPGWEKD